MKKNFDFFGIMTKFQAAAAKVKFFFAVLAKVEVFYFFPVALAIVFFAAVIDCVFSLASGGCPNIAKPIEGIIIFGLLSFVSAFAGLACIAADWDYTKKEVLIK